MDYNKGQATQAYPVATEAQEYIPHQPYGAQQQPYGAQPQPPPYYGQPGGATVAQPYNGPVAQQAVVGQAGNQGTHVVVVRQGQNAGPGPGAIPPPNNCVIAWLSCLCCCPLIGIAAICCASQVDRKWAGGDFDGAHKASAMAKKLSIVGIILGILNFILTTLYETETIEGGAADGDGSYSPDN
eukprot:g11687.t1